MAAERAAAAEEIRSVSSRLRAEGKEAEADALEREVRDLPPRDGVLAHRRTQVSDPCAIARAARPADADSPNCRCEAGRAEAKPRRQPLPGAARGVEQEPTQAARAPGHRAAAGLTTDLFFGYLYVMEALTNDDDG